jgi:hypothetical protein
MFGLPMELQRLIFEFDPTFRCIQWNKVIAQVNRNGQNYPHFFAGVNVYRKKRKYHYIYSKSYGYNIWIDCVGREDVNRPILYRGA